MTRKPFIQRIPRTLILDDLDDTHDGEIIAEILSIECDALHRHLAQLPREFQP